MAKPISQQHKRKAGAGDLETASRELVSQLADKPYGEAADKDKAVPLTITLPKSMVQKLEQRKRDNKDAGEGSKSVSALIREALERDGY